MTANQAYAINNKKIDGVISGVQSVTVRGTNLDWVFTDGTTATMTFPTPADGTSIKDVKIDDKNHVIITLSDNTVVDAGEMPSTKVAISKETGNAIAEKTDGLYVASTGVKISAKEGNIIKNETDGLYAKADTIEISKKTDNVIKNETDGLYVQKTVVDATYSSTSENAQSGKAVASAISTELGKLTYLTKEIVTQTEIDEYIADPTKAKFNVIYMLKDASAKKKDKFLEYQRIGDATTSTFECTGDTSTDLSDYAKSADVVAKNQTEANKGKMLVVGTDGNVTTSSTVKGNFYVEDTTPEGDRSGLSIIPNGSKTTIHPTGNSTAIEIDDDLILDGIVKKGDTTVLELGDKGHAYFKTGVDIGVKGSSPKPLNVHGTLNVDGHSIYCEGIKATDSIWVEDYVKTENLMSASATYLGNANGYSDIHFLCKNVRVVGEKGKEAMQMDSPLALMSAQTIMVGGKEVKQAHLDMGYDGGPGHISTGRLDVKLLQSNSNGGIDVGTPMRFHSHIDCGEINVKNGFAVTISDEASHQNMKLTSDGSIFCGDIHCNYPPSSPSGEGTKHSGNAYGEHSIDGVGYFTARNITTYESITYSRGGSNPPMHIGYQRKIATLTPSSTTASGSLITSRILQFALIKDSNSIEDIKEVYTEFEEHNGAGIILRTASNTTVSVGFNLAQGRLFANGAISAGYVVRVLGID